MKILVIDGKGGGIGRRILEKISASKIPIDKVYAVGTNATATGNMINVKHLRVEGATGTNPVKVLAKKVDIIIGPIAIISPNSMLGEITETIANSVSNSDALKLLLPINRCNLQVVGVKDIPLENFIDEIIDQLETTKV